MKRFLLLILLVLGTIAKPVFAEACLYAPPPRLTVDQAAVVVADGLSLRALPAVSTGLDGKLYAGNTLKVIAGPSCNGIYNWWRVETSAGVRGWVAEGTWDGYFVVPPEDAENPPTPFDTACIHDYDPIYCL
jgi:hypothetical protein